MNCKYCGHEISPKAKSCPKCGEKNKKPIYKRVWFWIITIIILLTVACGSIDSGEVNVAENGNNVIEEITYTPVSISTLYDELNANALVAEQTYNNTYVEVSGKIYNIDSDGSYITLEVPGYWIESLMCYISNEEQLNYIMTVQEGDQVVIQGQITDVGEVMGYSLEIHNIQ